MQAESRKKSSSPKKPRVWRKPWLRGVGLIGVAAIAGGGWKAWEFIHEDLAPLVSENLSESINRPLNVGELEGLSWNGLVFGRSTIPPHPYPDRDGVDQDSATVESVQVGFDLWQTVISQTLSLDVTLVEPKAYIDQTPNGGWLETQLKQTEEEGGFRIQVDRIRIQQGTVTVDPFQGASRRLEAVNGDIQLRDDAQTIVVALRSAIDSGGEVILNGQWSQATQRLAVRAQSKDVQVPPLLSFAPDLPLNIRSGVLSGTVDLVYAPQQPLVVKAKTQVKNGYTQLSEPRLRLAAKTLETDLDIRYSPNQQPIIAGQVDVRQASASVPEDLVLRNGRSRLQRAQAVNGKIKFLGSSQRAEFDLTGTLAAGGKFKAKGMSALDLSQTNLNLNARNVPARLMDQAYELPINVQKGTFNSNLAIKLRQDALPDLKGWVSLRDVDASIPQMPDGFYDANGDIRLEGLTANFNQVKARYGQVPLIAEGLIDPQKGYNLAVQVPPIEMNRALKTLQVDSLPFPVAGAVEVPNLRVTGAITTPVLSGTVQNRGKTVLDRVPFESVRANFRLDLPQLNITEIVAQPSGGGVVNGYASYEVSPDGSLQAFLDAKRMPGDAIAQRYGTSPDLKIGNVAAQVNIAGSPTNPTTTVQFQAPEAVYATRGSVVVQAGLTRLQNIVSQVAGGKVLTDGVIRDGQLNAQVRPQGIQLATFSPELRGTLNGAVDVATPIADASPQTLRASGNLNFSEGLSLIDDPISSAIAWDGQKIIVREATAPGFMARGSIGADINGPDGPQLTTLNLDLNARQFRLQSLAAFAPTDVELGGTADLDGRLSGTLAAPRLIATLGLDNLTVSQVAFESQLNGSLRYQPSGVDLNLSGDRDRIQVALASDFLPNRFLIQRDDAIAQGQRRGDILSASLAQFPLRMLNLKPAAQFGLGPVAGLASGTLTSNLNTFDTSGDFAVQKPSLGGLVGDRLTGEFQYQDGLAQLRNSQLTKQDSLYELDADLRLDEDPDVTGTLQIANAQIADVLYVTERIGGNGSTLDGPATGSAQDLQLTSVGLPRAPLMLQLQRLEEIKQLMAQAEQAEQDPPLALADLSGNIDGKINFQGSMATGVQGGFNLVGSDVQWGDYDLGRAIARGNLANNTLTFEPLRVANGSRIAQYTGSLGFQQQSGQLRLSQIPLSPLNRFMDLPGPVSGDLNGTAAIGGSLLNPSLNGKLALNQAQINETSVQSADARFRYEQARLQVNGTARLDHPEPISLTANIPYALPFAEVVPTSNNIAIGVKVQDEGLGLVNLLTDQVAWQGGNGLAALQVRGTLENPVLSGVITLDDATLATPTIENPITDVTGQLRFNQNLLQVSQLSGKYDQGEIQVAGALPLFDQALAPQSSLQVSLNDLDMNLNGLYEGEIDGQLLVLGSALAPTIGGGVRLQNGKVVLSNVAAAGGAEVPADASIPEGASTAENTSTPEESRPIGLKQLKVQVGDRVRISQPPVLSFIASGDLVVNGDLDNPRPAGTINFQKGTINLFTSRFRIDPKRENVAIFDPRYGVDPYLKLGMRSVVFDVIQGQTSELSDFESVPASSLGSVESVRVYADVDGFASKLQTDFKDVVAITSDPSRSEGEIVALLGGGVTDAVEGESVQNAALNVASSALLGNVQDLLTDVAGNRATISAFPVLLPDKENDKSVLSFGVEVGYDVTDRFSVSALQILTGVEQPTLFNLRYDLTDNLRARTSISSDGEGVGLFEYRLRF